MGESWRYGVVAALGGLACLLVVVAARPVGAALANLSERGIGPGTVLIRRQWWGAEGMVTAYVLRVDLANPRVRVGLLYPGRLAAVQPVSQMAARSGAFAAVNGDFFNIGAAGAPIGPVVSEGRLIKSPEVDRALAVGVGRDGIGRVAQVRLRGYVALPSGSHALSDLNDANLGPKPILASNGIGLFTGTWGAYPLAGAVHGLSGVTEVVVRHGRVAGVRQGRTALLRAGRSPAGVSPGTDVLLGAGRGGRALSGLRPGEPVPIRYEQATSAPVPFRWAIGGKYLLVHDGAVEPYLSTWPGKSRTAIGFSAGGHSLDLVVTVGAHPESAGLSLYQLAHFMRGLGVKNAVALDDGGSTTMVARLRPHARLTLLNAPAGGAERAVANGIGVFQQSRTAWMWSSRQTWTSSPAQSP